MNKRNLVRAGLAFALTAILLLSGCGAVVLAADVAPAPAGSDASDESLPAQRISVSTADELIAAVGSDRVIELAEAEFDLSAAQSYAGDTGNEHAYWQECYDGWELHIGDVQNLYILGQGVEKSAILTAPRYANVLSFDWCADVTLSGFTAGHTEEPGYCSGGVLYFSNSERMNVKTCELFGCGTIGISAFNSRNIYAEDTVIRDCSYGAVEAYNSYDLRFVGGKIMNCGQKGDGGYNFFSAQGSTGFAVLNTEIFGNKMETLLSSGNSRDVTLRGCSVHDNEFGKTMSYDGGANYSGAVFHISGESPVIDDCGFVSNAYTGAGMYYNYAGEDGGVAVDASGSVLTLAALDAMVQKDYTGTIELAQPVGMPRGEVDETGVTVYHVDNVDDFLAAIGSYTTIYVDAALLDFSEAANYGGYGSDYYYWENRYDGPSLVITGVQNLRIIGQGKDNTTVQAVPRYADVLRFEYCSNISVEELTAGHLREAPGSCSGDVLTFSWCDEVLVRGCGLFGCGVNGITADSCTGVAVEDTEIYECSNIGASLYNCDGVSFTGCRIHDCNYDGVYTGDCRNVTWEGKKLLAGWTKLG